MKRIVQLGLARVAEIDIFFNLKSIDFWKEINVRIQQIEICTPGFPAFSRAPNSLM